MRETLVCYIYISILMATRRLRRYGVEDTGESQGVGVGRGPHQGPIWGPQLRRDSQ